MSEHHDIEERLIACLEEGASPDPAHVEALAELQAMDRVLAAASEDATAPVLDGDLWPAIEARLESADEEAIERELERVVPAPGPSTNLLAGVMGALPADDDESTEPELEAALFAAGASIRAGVKEIDIAAEVMATVSGPRVLPRTESQPDRRAKAERLRMSNLAALAAAVLAMVAIGSLAQAYLRAQSGDERLAGGTAPQEYTQERTAPDGALEPMPVPDSPPMQVAENIALEEPGAGDLSPVEPGDVEPQALRPLTLKEVVDTHANAMRDNAEALQRMGRWASLTREEASELLNQSGMDNDAVLGAAQFLPPEDAIPVLKAAVEANPEDPHLRYALSDQYRSAEQDEQYVSSLRDWQSVDPGNSLPHFMEAEMLFASGDYAGGRAALERGAVSPSASSYEIATASQHASALEANGTDRSSAEYVAASTTGSDEYARLHDLSDSLLDQGRQLEEDGLLQEAADLYDAVRLLGEQTEVGASSPNTLTAGLEIQESALNALYAIQGIWDSDALDSIAVMAEDVVAGLDTLSDFSTSLADLLSADPVASGEAYAETLFADSFRSMLDNFQQTGNLF